MRTLRWLLLLVVAVAASGADPLADQMQAQLRAKDYASAAQSAQALLVASELAGDKTNTGLAHWGLGESSAARGDYRTAHEHYAKAARLAVELGVTDGAAYCYHMDGVCTRVIGLWRECAEALRLALRYYGADGDKTLRGKALIFRGEALGRQGMLPEAAQATQAGIDLLRGTPALADYISGIYQMGLISSVTGDDAVATKRFEEGLALAREARLPAVIAVGLNDLAASDEAAGRYADAEQKLREALDGYQKTGETEWLDTICGNLARIVAAQGRTDDGVKLFQAAIMLAERRQADAHLGQHLTELGEVLIGVGKLDEALEVLGRAEQIRARIGDDLGITLTWCNQAMARCNQGELRDALAVYLKVAVTYEKMGLKELLCSVLNNIGRIYDTQGDLESAVAYFKRSLALAVEIRRPVDIAVGYNNIGTALYNKIKPALPLDPKDTSVLARQVRELLTQTRDAFTQAAQVFEQANLLSYAATALNNLGQATADAGNLDDAERYLHASLTLHKRVGALPGQYQALSNLGMLALQRGQLDQADELLRQALAQAVQCGDVEVQSGVWLNLAMLHKARGKLTEAVDAAAHALVLIEQRRELIGGGEHEQRQFLAANQSAYQCTIELLMAARRPADAFMVSERSRARSMLEMLIGGRLDLHSRLPAAEVAPLHTREAALAAAQAALSHLANTAGTPDAALAKARGAVVTARAAVDAEEQRLQAEHPGEKKGSGVEPLDLPEVGRLLPPDTALLEFASGLAESWVFVVTVDAAGRPGLHTYTIEAGQGSVQDLVSRYRSACANPRRKFKELGAELYAKLLGKAVPELPPAVKRLIVVPDQTLFDCPFHALWDDATQTFLADRYEVVYTGSASLLGASLNLGQERRAQPADGGMLLVADPDFGTDAAEPAPVARDARGARLARLPGTRIEALAIAKLMPHVTERTGRDAQERTIKQELPRYRWLHFATHGLLEPDQPLYSAIALAKPDQPGEDGYLEARELANLTLHAELVTLSACQTGRGQAQAGEGLIGLPWAFTVAHVPTQIVSLWSVDDAVTKELMQRFYTHLAAGKPKAQALREAELELRKTQLTLPDGDTIRPEHPFYWAPFVLLGDWR